MTESLIAPEQTSQGAGNDVAPPSSRHEGPEQQAASDAAALIYRDSEAEAEETAEPDAPPAPDSLSGEQAAVTYEPFALPQGVEVDSAEVEAQIALRPVGQQDHSGSAATLLSMWGEEDWAVWAAIVAFWFGNRTFNKERGRG